ncbi:MAG TPA: hypothetical protein VNM87_14185, partial [Candidatus Udaeobacter sp.]|nr:hypothetical protein [Candidatus Udaeobacter sp.]
MKSRAPARRAARSAFPEPSNGGSATVATPEQADALDIRQLLQALQAVRDGDFSARLPGNWTGLGGKVADTFNEIVASNARLERELERVGQAVGKEGRTRQRVSYQ